MIVYHGGSVDGDGLSSNLSKITYSSDIYPMVDGIEKLNVLTCDKQKTLNIITNPPFLKH